jgi:hypothetical protein
MRLGLAGTEAEEAVAGRQVLLPSRIVRILLCAERQEKSWRSFLSRVCSGKGMDRINRMNRIEKGKSKK